MKDCFLRRGSVASAAILASVSLRAMAAATTVGQIAVPEPDTTASVALTLSHSEAESVCALQIDLEFDGTALVLDTVARGSSAVSAEKDVSFVSAETGKIRILVVGMNTNTIPNGDVATLELTIPAETVVGTYPLVLSGVVASDAVGASIACSGVSGAVVVGGGPEPPAIVSDPASLIVDAGQTAVFAVSATGSAPLSYQWRLNGAAIAGATISECSVYNASFAHEGSYSCRVSNAGGERVSNGATLTIRRLLRVTEPNGGETLGRGTQFLIPLGWYAPDTTGDVRIYLYNNWTKIRVLADARAANGVWNWIVPADEACGANYRIRVQSLEHTSLNDYSDGAFAIADPAITVVAPNGGEIVGQGGTLPITWNAPGVPANVRIYLYSNWTKVRILADVAAGNGVWNWTVPADEPSATNYRIRVQSHQTTSVQDCGDKLFCVGSPAIEVVSPNGGETYGRGMTFPIAWRATGVTGGVRLYLYINWTKLRTLADVAAANGVWNWTVPADETVAPNYRIRVQSLECTSVNGFGDGGFAIADPAITVASPNGGEIFARPATYPVTWNAPGLAGNVRVYLYANWAKLRTLGDAPAAAGSWNWTIPASETAAANYRIRVQSLARTDLNDYGDAVFSVTAQ